MTRYKTKMVIELSTEADSKEEADAKFREMHAGIIAHLIENGAEDNRSYKPEIMK